MRLTRRKSLMLGGAAAGALFTQPHLALAQGGSADLVLVNGRITTMDPARPEATALAARDGTFVAVGSDAEMQPLIGPFTQVIDARGQRVIPGLNDSHTHAIRGAVNYNLEVRWDGVDSLEEALHLLRVQAERTPNGQFIRVAGGFSEFQFKEKRLPTVAELDAVAPNHPVLIHHLYKLTLLNTKALEWYALVTSASHMPRALATFREAGWPDMIPVPVSYTTPPGAGLWRVGPMQVSEGLRLLDDAAREWMALAYYRWRGITDRLLPTAPAER